MRLRKDQMSHQERIEALLNYQEPDQIPLYPFLPGFCAKNVGYLASIYKVCSSLFERSQPENIDPGD